MEDRKLNELTDEALDAVTGGAYYRQDPTDSNKYIVYDKDGNQFATMRGEDKARAFARALSDGERWQEQKRLPRELEQGAIR